jgi:hypothetical protein
MGEAEKSPLQEALDTERAIREGSLNTPEGIDRYLESKKAAKTAEKAGDQEQNAAKAAADKIFPGKEKPLQLSKKPFETVKQFLAAELPPQIKLLRTTEKDRELEATLQISVDDQAFNVLLLGRKFEGQKKHQYVFQLVDIATSRIFLAKDFLLAKDEASQTKALSVWFKEDMPQIENRLVKIHFSHKDYLIWKYDQT